MVAQQTLDQTQVEAFAGKVLGDSAGVTNTALASIGDRLGLFKILAANGPLTSAELAKRADVNERYAREWLAAMASAEYLTYDPTTARFTLPAEHAPALAQEGGPMFLAGAQQELMGLLGTLDGVASAFRTGGGVAIADFKTGYVGRAGAAHGDMGQQSAHPELAASYTRRAETTGARRDASRRRQPGTGRPSSSSQRRSQGAASLATTSTSIPSTARAPPPSELV